MAWRVVENFTRQLLNQYTGAPISGAYLKAYESGSTPGAGTVVTMATDAAGTSTTEFVSNSAGKWTVSSVKKRVFIDRKVKFVIYPNQTDADAHDTTNAIDIIDEVEGIITTSAGELWSLFSGTPTQTSATTFTVTGDQTSTFTVGTRLKLDDASTLYGIVTASAYTSLTTVTVTLDSGSLTGSLTKVYTSIATTTEKPISADAVSLNLIQSGFVNRSLYEVFLDMGIPVTGAGAVFDGSTDDAAAIQRVIDFLNSSYLGGTFGGEAGIAILPRGVAICSGIIVKKGVSLIGEGQGRTVLLMSTDQGTMIKCPAKASQVAVDVVAQGILKGFTLGISSGLTPTGTTILLDHSGFTKFQFEDLNFVVPSNVIGAENTGNTLAGSGGPAHWYNVWRHVIVDLSGGIGVRWGDADTATEQVTAQSWYGGRIGGTSGIGIHIRGGTGNNFFGLSLEGLNSGSNKSMIIGDTTGARVSTSNNLHGCYLEQVDITYYSNSNRNRRWGCFETTVSESDNGTRNGRADHEELYRGWPRVYASGRVTTPTTVNKSYNVTSVSNPSTGLYEITFTTALADTNYVAQAISESSDLYVRVSTKTTTTCRFLFLDAAGAAADPTSFNFSIIDNDS